MKIRRKLLTASAALSIMVTIFPWLTVRASGAAQATTQDSVSMCDEMPSQEPAPVEENDTPASDEPPMFTAGIKYSPQGYVVMGTFTEFLPDTSFVQPIYSLDGETYQPCGINWDLYLLHSEYADKQAKLQNQICLYDSNEPLKSFLAGELDRFFLKLSLTRENGITYETQAAVIDRGSPQPVPEDITLAARFASSVLVLELRPFKYYGRYQLTVDVNTTPEEISSYLPDTLPVEVQLLKGINFVTGCTIDCPVTWKPLSLPQLNAGESVIVQDAVENITVPCGTLLNTPCGIFQMDNALPLDGDEVMLILNVIAENENPTGAISAENYGLEIAFNLKPTGATAIRTYTLSNLDTEWTEIPTPPLLEAINAQPSTPNSGYTLILRNDNEPYRSYLAAKAAGDTPEPFYIGLKIEGGIYDGRQLILAWPDSYDLPLNLPVLGGSGGNESNAGASRKNNGTEEGQRPGISMNREDEKTDSPVQPDNSPEHERQQIQDASYKSDEFDTAGKPPLTAPSVADADTNAEENEPSLETSSPDNTAGNTQIQKKNDPDTVLSGKRASLFPKAAIAVAAICAAAAIGRAVITAIAGRIKKGVK